MVSIKYKTQQTQSFRINKNISVTTGKIQRKFLCEPIMKTFERTAPPWNFQHVRKWNSENIYKQF